MHFSIESFSKLTTYLEVHSWASELKEYESLSELQIAHGKTITKTNKQTNQTNQPIKKPFGK